MSSGKTNAQELEEVVEWIVEKSKPLYVKGYLQGYEGATTWDLYFVRSDEQKEDSVKFPRQSRDRTPEGWNREKKMIVERLIEQREDEADRVHLATLLTIWFEPPSE